MSNIIGSLLLILFCALVSYWEYSQDNTIITPFGVLAWPYTVVVTMINFGGRFFGFFPVSLKSILFVIVSLIFFLIAGRFALLFFKNFPRSNCQAKENIQNIFDFYRPLFVFLAVISIISGLIQSYRSIGSVGWMGIASTEFAKTYESGVFAHLMILSRLGFIFLLGDYLFSKKKYILALLFGMFFIVFISQIKYHIFGIILGGVYFAISYRLINFSIKKLFLYLAIVFILFVATYYIGFLAVGSKYAVAKKTQNWLLNLFFTYLFGGPIGFSEILNNHAFPIYSLKEIFAAPINIYRFLIGDHNFIDIIIHHRISVSNHYKMFHNTNIYGMIGMVYMYGGFYFTIFYMLTAGFISYLLFGLALSFKKLVCIQLVYAFVMAFLTLAFFDLYFNKLISFEATFYMILFPSVYFIIKKLFKFTLLQYQ